MKPVLFLHEIKRNITSLAVWSFAMAFMLGICIIIYPEMQSQMGEMSEMLSEMGAFSEAFGMDQINFGEFMGYFGVECGNTLGLGGAMLAAIVGVLSLAKEEKNSTADFLLTLPVSRYRVVSEKLLFSIFHIVTVNVAVAIVSVLGSLVIGVDADYGEMLLILLAYFLMQIEITAICFGISAFVKKGGLGIGIGLGFVFYFMGIFSKLTDELEFIKYLTPFGFADSAYILDKGGLEPISLVVGLILSAVSVALAYWYYGKKDIT